MYVYSPNIFSRVTNQGKQGLCMDYEVHNLPFSYDYI